MVGYWLGVHQVSDGSTIAYSHPASDTRPNSRMMSPRTRTVNKLDIPYWITRVGTSGGKSNLRETIKLEVSAFEEVQQEWTGVLCKASCRDICFCIL